MKKIIIKVRKTVAIFLIATTTITISLAEDMILDTSAEVASKIKQYHMKLLKFELHRDYDHLFGMFEKDFFNLFSSKKDYISWSENKYKALTFVPPFKSKFFFISKNHDDPKESYYVKMVVVDGLDQELNDLSGIHDIETCHLYSKINNSFRPVAFIYDCSPF